MARETYDYRILLSEQVEAIKKQVGDKDFLNVGETMRVLHIGHGKARKLPFVAGRISVTKLASLFVRESIDL